MLSGAAKQNRDIALCITVHVYLIHATGSGIRAYARLRFAKSVAREKWLRAQEKSNQSKTKTTAKTTSKKSSRTRLPTRTTAASQTALHRQAAGATKKCVLRKGYKKQCAKTVAASAEPTLALNSVKSKCVVRKGYKKRCKPEASEANLTIADAHKVRVQKAQSTAMNKLMGQLGKPYRWGGTSPRTGFDCSGLVYYAYKDLVKIHIPRTANEMYHLRDARPVDRDELQSGDLVFFRTRGRGAADHVGVYVATENSFSRRAQVVIFKSPP